MVTRNVQFLNKPEFIHATHATDGPVDTVFVSCPASNKVFVVQQNGPGNVKIIREITMTMQAMRAYGTALTDLTLCGLDDDKVIIYNYNSDSITEIAETGVNPRWMATDGVRFLYSVDNELVLREGVLGAEKNRISTFFPSEAGFIDSTATTNWVTIGSDTQFQYGTIDVPNTKIILDYHGILPQAKNVEGGFYRGSILILASQSTIRTYALTVLETPTLTTTERFGFNINDLIFHPNTTNTRVIAGDEKDANSILDFFYPRETATEIGAGVVMAHKRLPFISKTIDDVFASPTATYLLFDGDTVDTSGWTVTAGQFTQQLANSFPGDRGNTIHDNTIFGLGGTSTPSVAFKDTPIVIPELDFTLSAWMGGFETQADAAVISLEWRDIGDTPISTFSITAPTPAERGNVTGFLFKSVTGVVPINASYGRVTITMTRITGAVNDSYVDAIIVQIGDPSA